MPRATDPSTVGDARRSARAWIRAQTGSSRQATRPVVMLGLAGTILAIMQAFCLSHGLATAMGGQAVPLRFLVVFAVAALGRAGIQMGAETLAQRAGAQARSRLRADSLHRLLLAGPNLLRGRHTADLASLLVDHVESLDGLFRNWLPAARLAVLVPVLVVAAAACADPAGAAILAGAGLLVPFGMALSGLGAAAASRDQFLALSRLQARFLDRVRGIATIVLSGRAEDEARRLQQAADELRRRTMRVLRVAFLSSAVLDCAAAAALVLLALRYGLRLTDAAMRARPAMSQAAQALFMLLLVPEFFAPLRAFSAAYQDRSHAAPAAEALMQVPPLPAPSTLPAPRTVAAHGLTVTFENVGLVWDERRGAVLQDVSFRVPAGETLVLLGASGAGKTSILELLLGFARPGSGRITINGADMADIVPDAMAKLTGWIGQRPVLFAGSIRDNILFARPDASEAELLDAVRAARLDGVAADLPHGLDTQIGEGGHGLSGGQAQRVAIARAFLKNAPLLLLDEPTSHLDPATEQEVLDSLRRLALGRTVILASHATAAQGFGGRRIEIRDGRVLSVQGAA